MISTTESGVIIGHCRRSDRRQLVRSAANGLRFDVLDTLIKIIGYSVLAWLAFVLFFKAIELFGWLIGVGITLAFWGLVIYGLVTVVG